MCIRDSNGSFDVFRSKASDLSVLTGPPLSGSAGLVFDPVTEKAGSVSRSGIHLDGIDVAIDESLYIDAIKDSLVLRNSSVSLDSSKDVAGSLTLTGQAVDLKGETRLFRVGFRVVV